ncbi:hypothetical protein Mapa_000793 [Marchantia paleacea]|nr:hypothetical protein Mapa_000793 [Marchantia paleacea]
MILNLKFHESSEALSPANTVRKSRQPQPQLLLCCVLMLTFQYSIRLGPPLAAKVKYQLREKQHNDRACHNSCTPSHFALIA